MIHACCGSLRLAATGLGALLAVLLLAPAGSSAQTPPLDLLTLHARALQTAPSLRAAEALRGEREAGLETASSRLGPQVEALWQAGEGQDRLAGRSHVAALQLSQPLWDRPLRHSRDAARQRLTASEAELAASQQLQRQTSARLVVQLHAQTQLQQVQRELEKAYADEAQRMGVRHREGLTAAVDWRQSQSFQLLAGAGARGGAQQLRALRLALAAHVGDATLVDATIAGLRAQALPPPLQAADTLSQRREAQRAERDARQEELEAARHADSPTLSLQAQAQQNLQSRPRAGSEWSLQLRLPLWDSGSRAAGRHAASQRLLAAEAELLLMDRELAREQATQAERLLAAREQHATATAGLAAAEQTVAAMRVGQEQGTRSTTDVLLALQTQGQLRQLAVTAQAEAWLAWIDGLVAQGRFDGAALQALNTHLE
ncbi:MAG: TolC family protein [Inhella sp.]|nr:TolC family protein [Inhella sp.]